MDETQQSRADYFRYRIRRDSSGALEWFRGNWRSSKRFRWASSALGALLALCIVGWAVVTHDLPDANKLLTYEPPLPTMVRGADGEIVYTYARERRVQLQFQDFPTQLINAYTSAEDKTFWTHGGVDIGGLIGAVFDYATKIGSGARAKGGSTITQQVAKNILVGNEYSISRKLREMILARRIEGVLNKQEIITLYLNEIPLGRRAFGVQAASRAYFDKDVDQLTLPQMAFLAILPKAPEHYSRAKYADDAIARRNYVLDEMVDNGHISRAQADEAKAAPLGIVNEHDDTRIVDAGYFLEEVRRELLDKYGENAEDGPNSVYAGGLWVRTSLDPDMQYAARDAMQAGLFRYYAGKAWTRPIAWIDPSKGSLTSQLAGSNLSIRYKDWRVGVVTERSGPSARIGFANGSEGPLTGLPAALKVGDVVAVGPAGTAWTVKTLPEVSGGFVAMDPHNGRVFAMQGGFDSRLGSFNRATQALRQPGSTIKPFVYATALDNGMTPATMVPDTAYCVYQGAALGNKCFRNFANEGGGGEHTMRWGLEQSRNLMTVHIASDVGMENVTRTLSRLGIGDYQNYLSYALGAGDTTVLKILDAYTAIFDHGMQHTATVIDYVQDRRGKVIWRADQRECAGCNMAEWDGKAMPRLPESGRQTMDPRTAYQVVHMMEGVVQRGTAARVRSLGLPLAGKTGTTNGPTNVWFIGGSPDLITGTYVGYDQPRNLGGWVQGANIAAPIFMDFVKATRDKWSDRPFLAPPGIRMVRIDRRTGTRVFDANPTDDPLSSVIWEAFKPDTEPRKPQRQDEIDAMRDTILAQLRRQQQGPAANPVGREEPPPTDFVEEQGGLY
jgi:penicillin-binding protein 1A